MDIPPGKPKKQDYYRSSAVYLFRLIRVARTFSYPDASPLTAQQLVAAAHIAANIEGLVIEVTDTCFQFLVQRCIFFTAIEYGGVF
jgi:hypothetical protein